MRGTKIIHAVTHHAAWRSKTKRDVIARRRATTVWCSSIIPLMFVLLLPQAVPAYAQQPSKPDLVAAKSRLLDALGKLAYPVAIPGPDLVASTLAVPLSIRTTPSFDAKACPTYASEVSTLYQGDGSFWNVDTPNETSDAGEPQRGHDVEGWVLIERDRKACAINPRDRFQVEIHNISHDLCLTEAEVQSATRSNDARFVATLGDVTIRDAVIQTNFGKVMVETLTNSAINKGCVFSLIISNASIR